MSTLDPSIGRRLCLGAIALLAASALAGCGQKATDDSATSAPRPAAGSAPAAAAPSAELVAAAGTRSAQAASVSMQATITRNGEVVSQLTSTSNADGSRVAIRSELPGAVTFEARGIDGTWYLEMPSPGAEAGWISVDTEALGSTASALAGGPVETDPRSVFDALADVSSKVVEVGSEQIEGVSTTRYRMTVEATELGAGPAELDVWIDDEGLVRRLRSELDDPTGGSAGLHVIDVVVSSYDEPFDVVAPAPEDTVSMDELLAEGGLGGLAEIIGGD